MWIEELPNGKYRACERYTDALTGKTRKVSVTIEKTTKQAQKAAEVTLREKIEAKQTIKSTDSITLKELSEKYISWQKKQIKPSSMQSTVYYTDYLLRIIGPDALISRMTAGLISEIIMNTELSDYSINRCILYFKAMINWGYDHDLVADKQWLDKIKRVEEKKVPEDIRQKYLEPDELKILTDSLEGYEHWQLAVKFLVLSGLRIGEMIALLDSDVDNEGIHVTKTYHTGSGLFLDSPKTKSGNRVVYIQPELETVVRQIRSYRNRVMLKTGIRTDSFLPNYNGTIFSHNGFDHELLKQSRKHLGRDVNPHMLRHTHVSLLAEQGVPLETISRRLGHSGSALTKEIYLHVTKKRKQLDNDLIRAVNIF